MFGLYDFLSQWYGKPYSFNVIPICKLLKIIFFLASKFFHQSVLDQNLFWKLYFDSEMFGFTKYSFTKSFWTHKQLVQNKFLMLRYNFFLIPSQECLGITKGCVTCFLSNKYFLECLIIYIEISVSKSYFPRHDGATIVV